MADYSKATNFTAKDGLPTGNAGKIVKGTEIDTELTAISSAIASKSNINSPTFTGTPAGPTASFGTNTTQIATTAFVQTALASAFTSGMIMLWSGSVATIPSGWYLCNGSNSTPDLRDRFVIGAGSTYAVAATGGTADAVVVSHTHTATSTDSGHTHTVPSGASGASTPTGPAPAASISGQTTATGTAIITTTVASTGVSGTGQNLPPYYALAYIMKA
jgi:hypothetical protein